MSEKLKIAHVSDIILSNSGVARQNRLILDHLNKTNKYDIIHIGSAVRHKNYNVIDKPKEFPNTKIIPVDGFGNKAFYRQLIDIERPDILFLSSDPRFYADNVWQITDEINQVCPIFYWTLWDNFPITNHKVGDKVIKIDNHYNFTFYQGIDHIASINKILYNELKDSKFSHKISYIPHAVPEDQFYPLSEDEITKIRKAHVDEKVAGKDGFIVFYNSRNALRKRTGNVIMAFQYFMESLPEKEKEKVLLCMKSSPADPEGQALRVLTKDLGLEGKVVFADQNFDDKQMNEFYNMSDVTISLSSEEGFGLCVLESLMTGTPVIATRTGGMQDQLKDPDTGEVFGYMLEPDASSLIGSQSTPYIFSDHVAPEKAGKYLYEVYKRKKEHGDHKKYFAGQKARESMIRRFHLPAIQKQMEETIDKTIEQFKQKQQQQKEYRVVRV